MDTVSKRTRSRLMAGIRSKDTHPEKAVRSMLHRMGYRFRLHRADLPGRPDIALPKHRKLVLVHGCFWHQHRGCALASKPSSNVQYWSTKLANNIARDKRNRMKLRRLGWKVLVIWECQTRDTVRMERVLSRFMAREYQNLR